jgi:hypothetical protein
MVQRTSGPLSGQALSMFFWGDVLFLSGPRYWGQSCACTEVIQSSDAIKDVITQLDFMDLIIEAI